MNKNILVAVLMFSTAVYYCKSDEPVTDANSKQGSVAISLDEIDLIPEGIAYDSQTGHFFLSSIHKQKIVGVKKDGSHYDFIESGADSMAGSLGLKVDTKRRRLWALSNESDRKYSAVHVYDIDTRKLINKLIAPTNEPHTLNDVALTQAGEAFITDTDGSQIYFVPENLSRLELFMSHHTLLTEVNGITISPDNLHLYVASTTTGINRINIAVKSIEPLENWLSTDTRGVDGLNIYKNSLIGVRNGIRELPGFHITRYYLNKRGNEIVGAELLDHKNEQIEVPTTGIVVGDNYYCLAVTSLVVKILNRMNEVELLKNPTVLKYNLTVNRNMQ